MRGSAARTTSEKREHQPHSCENPKIQDPNPKGVTPTPPGGSRGDSFWGFGIWDFLLIGVDRAFGDLEEDVLELPFKLRLAPEVVHPPQRDDLALEHDPDPVGEVLGDRKDVGGH